MKIIIYCPFIAKGKGGLERVGVELANEMARRGHEIHLAYNAYKDSVPHFKVIDKVVLIPWDKPISHFREKIIEIDPDVFFVFNGGHNIISFSKIVYGSKIPFAYQEATNPKRLIRDNWSKAKKISLCEAAWERDVVASGAVRIRQTMPSYKASFPLYIQKQVRYFPNAVIPAKKIADASYNGSSKKTLINIGGLKKVKNIIPLLEAFAQLQPKFSDWQIKVFGGGFDNEKDYQFEIENRVKRLNLESSVLFMGETEEIYKEYEQSHIHIITSNDEGRPTCVCEAMSHGLPSIGLSECPGTNELIKHQENGLLVDSKNNLHDNLVKSLKRLMSSHNERKIFGLQAYEDSLAFNPAAVYDKWESFFNEAALYKNNVDKLFVEQCEINYELALHTLRMRMNNIF